MIRHWKSLDLEITGFGYYHAPTTSGEMIPSIFYIFDVV